MKPKRDNWALLEERRYKNKFTAPDRRLNNIESRELTPEDLRRFESDEIRRFLSRLR